MCLHLSTMLGVCALPRPPEQKVSRKFREKVSTTFLKLRQQQQDDPTLRRKLRRLSSKR